MGEGVMNEMFVQWVDGGSYSFLSHPPDIVSFSWLVLSPNLGCLASGVGGEENRPHHPKSEDTNHRTQHTDCRSRDRHDTSPHRQPDKEIDVGPGLVVMSVVGVRRAEKWWRCQGG